MSSNSKKRTTEIANLLAIAVVLEFVSNLFLPQFRFGTGISLVAYVPILLISYRYGMKWGMLSGLIFGFLQVLLEEDVISGLFDKGFFRGASYKGWLMILLDYFVACTAVGLGGIFRKAEHSRKRNFMLGSLVSLGICYGIHILCGCLVYGAPVAKWYFNGRCDITTINLDHFSWAPDWLLSIIFSVFYNSLYMLPNIALSIIACWILSGNRKWVTRVKHR